MVDLKDIRHIGIDADDTLWECGQFYMDVQEDYFQILLENSDLDYIDISSGLDDVEERNMELLGYGAKAMTISMIENAIAFKPNISTKDILRIIDLGRSLLETPVIMHQDVQKTLDALVKKYHVMIITQGDLREQRRKFERSPLSRDIEYVVVPEKTPESFKDILARRDISPHHFLMIGDSPKSDITPVLDIGGYAAVLPSDVTWGLEMLGVSMEHDRLVKLKGIAEILDILGMK